MSRLTRVACTVALVAVGMVGTTAAAYADKDSYVTGGHAWRGSDVTVVYIKDTLANSESVYAQYKLGSSTINRLDNNLGANQTVSADRTSTITALRACQDINLAPDACDAWK